jgi:hypothetical protein
VVVAQIPRRVAQGAEQPAKTPDLLAADVRILLVAERNLPVVLAVAEGLAGLVQAYRVVLDKMVLEPVAAGVADILVAGVAVITSQAMPRAPVAVVLGTITPPTFLARPLQPGIIRPLGTHQILIAVAPEMVVAAQVLLLASLGKLS